MNVHYLGPEDVHWPMGRVAEPHYRVKDGDYTRDVPIDPYPAYAPDLGLVKDLVHECVSTFPLQGQQNLYVLGHEFAHRTNGFTSGSRLYRSREFEVPKFDGVGTITERVISNTITLSAKRIPIHPAMTRYLVAHEYGHAAFNCAAQALGYSPQDEEVLKKSYSQMRGVYQDELPYVGGKWHLAIGEIIANDFRIVMTEREVEFWPHVVARPNSVVLDWWLRAREAVSRLRASL